MRKDLIGTILLVLAGVSPAAAQAPSELLGPTDFAQTARFADAPLGEGGPAPEGCDCVQRSRLYADAAYLVLWFRHSTPPPLIAIGPAASAGMPLTTIIYGGQDTNFGAFSGARTTVGYWLDPQQTWGFEAGGLLTDQRVQNFVASHDGSRTNPFALGRVDFTAGGRGPFFAPVVGISGFVHGSETVTETSRLWTADGNFVLNWRESGRTRIDLMAGFRYMDLEERLRVRDDSQGNNFPAIPFSRTDEFATHNQFYGAQVGSRTVFTYDRLSLTMVGKLAVGATHQVVDKSGELQVSGDSRPGGYLVPAGNVGRDSLDRFALMSESTIQLGYKLTQRLEAHLGYELLYLSSVARPADQIFDTGSAIGPLATGIHVTDFFAQGVQVGMTFKW